MPEPLAVRPSTASVYINCQAISHNAAIAKSLSPQARLLCMIKANAYGHGIKEVSRQLDSACDGFGVARVNEAKLLRENGCDKPIVVMSEPLNIALLKTYQQFQLTPVIHADANACAIAEDCFEKQLPYWLKLDTGMHRLGLSATTFKTLSHKAEVIATHMHSADLLDNTGVDAQIDSFQKLAVESDYAHFSLANSATLLRHATPENYASWLKQHTPGFNNRQEIIRPGIMLYGADPLVKPNLCSKQLKPAMTFAAPVIDIHRVATGDGVGYAHRWIAQRDSVIATVAAGYGDGYPRHARNGTPVIINGQQGKLAGTVSMDMIGVDITDLPGIAIGDTALLWGEQLPVEQVAACADTISYSLLTAITDRVERIYL